MAIDAIPEFKQHITHELIELPVRMGKVLKSDLKKALGCHNVHYWLKHINEIRQMDEKFRKEYKSYNKKYDMPQALALKIVKYLCPLHDVKIVIKPVKTIKKN